MESTCDENEEIEQIKSDIQKLETKISYSFQNGDVLVHQQTGELFKFQDKDEYEKISQYVIKYVQYQLLDKYKMKTLWAPLKFVTREFSKFYSKSPTNPQCEIYVSEDFLYNNGKLLCLVQGTGNVRAGLWARSVCINHSLELGSVLPFVETAQNLNMSVCIFNPNERKDANTGASIVQFSSMEKHCLWVYENIIKKFSKAREIYFVSHSMGGYCTVDIVKAYKNDVINGLIKKIAFTDSVHGQRYKILDRKTYSAFVKISRNYVTSQKPLNTFLRRYDKSYDGVDNYSAGHSKHEYTSGCAREAIFDYFLN